MRNARSAMGPVCAEIVGDHERSGVDVVEILAVRDVTEQVGWIALYATGRENVPGVMALENAKGNQNDE